MRVDTASQDLRGLGQEVTLKVEPSNSVTDDFGFLIVREDASEVGETDDLPAHGSFDMVWVHRFGGEEGVSHRKKR